MTWPTILKGHQGHTMKQRTESSENAGETVRKVAKKIFMTE